VRGAWCESKTTAILQAIIPPGTGTRYQVRGRDLISRPIGALREYWAYVGPKAARS